MNVLHVLIDVTEPMEAAGTLLGLILATAMQDILLVEGLAMVGYNRYNNRYNL